MKLLRLIRMVLWAFFGVRKKAGFNQDLASTRPLHVIAAGLIIAAILIGLLLALVIIAVKIAQ